MLSKFSNSRTFEDNLRLGVLTAFVAGMVNIASLLLFFSFTSNVTGHYAILAAEIVKGNFYQVSVVFSWIFLFFFGGFMSNLIIINANKKSHYLAHAIPVLLEIICLLAVGIYGQFFYRETLLETEMLVALMLFAMGLQNGLTASISNFTVKTTHLTGATTDLGILFSMFTQRKFRKRKELRERATLLVSVAASYITGAIVCGVTYGHIQFKVFYIVCSFLLVVLFYDLYKVRTLRMLSLKDLMSKRISLADISDLTKVNKKEEESAVY